MSIHNIGIVSDYPPRRCGIATFAGDICHSIADNQTHCFVVAVNDTPGGYDYPQEVRFQINSDDAADYRRAAEFLNLTNVDVVNIQHEFGIYGGPAGAHILALLRRLNVPIITTLHTILQEPDADQMRVMLEIVHLSSRIIVMTERGKQMLLSTYPAEAGQIDVIPHGVPDVAFVDPNYYKDQFNVAGKWVLLTFGLLSPGKGIEYVIKALPNVVEEVPDLVYIVLGATHPNIIRDQGEAYRHQLQRLADDLRVREHVRFDNRFVDNETLREFLGAADVYITPYLNAAQITSGTLAYAFGSGKAVISTPYWHAEELLADGRGVLVPFRNSDVIASELISLRHDNVRRHAMRRQAYRLGREMTWEQIARQYVASFRMAKQTQARGAWMHTPVDFLNERERTPPELRLDHLRRMSDSTGIFQHATYFLPSLSEGYCVDDNARALLLTVLLEEENTDMRWVADLMPIYAAFVNHAFIPDSGRFHNFMGFDRRWCDTTGSDDTLGRVLHALGAAIRRSRREDFRRWALQLFDRALPAVLETTSPRAWALGILAMDEYSRRFNGNMVVAATRNELTRRLLHEYHEASNADWQWFEKILSYDNARLSQALILCGRYAPGEYACKTGLRSLRWLMRRQTAKRGHFRPIGSNGFHREGGDRADFDQQPIEALATVEACVAAWEVTNDAIWISEAWRAFEWFLGRNDLGQSLVDSEGGGCYDGLHVDRLNRNQGAESTLSYLLALLHIRRVSTRSAAVITTSTVRSADPMVVAKKS